LVVCDSFRVVLERAALYKYVESPVTFTFVIPRSPPPSLKLNFTSEHINAVGPRELFVDGPFSLGFVSERAMFLRRFPAMTPSWFLWAPVGLSLFRRSVKLFIWDLFSFPFDRKACPLATASLAVEDGSKAP